MSGKIKNFKCFERLQLTMAEFLYTYLGIADEKFFKATHEDLKRLLPELKRISFDNAFTNKELIFSGETLLIKDCKNRVVPYVNPFRNNDLEVINIKDDLVKTSIKSTTREVNLKEMTNYHLKQEYKLQRKSHKLGKYKMCRLIRNEMKDRNIETPGRKKILIREANNIDRREDYDKY